MDAYEIFRLLMYVAVAVAFFEMLWWLCKQIYTLYWKMRAMKYEPMIDKYNEGVVDGSITPHSEHNFPLRDYRIVAPRLTATSPRGKCARSRG